MPRPGDPSPITVTDSLLAKVLDAQRELVTEIQGLRRVLTDTRSSAPRAGQVDVSEPARPGTGARVPGRTGLTEPAARRTTRRT